MTDQAPAAAAPAAAPAAPSTASTLPSSPALAPIGTGSTAADAAMAQALVDRGRWTPEQAATALAQVDSDHEGDGAGAGAEESAPPFNPYAAVADMKSTLAAVGIEGKDAGAAEYIVKTGLARAPTPEQNIQACGEAQQNLEALHGKEKAGWVIEWARREFQHLAAANPKLIDLAERSGAGNSIALIQQLANRGMTRYNKARFTK